MQAAWWEAAPWQAWQASPEQRQDAAQHHGEDEESDDDFCEVDIGAYLSYESTEALVLMPLLEKEASTNRWVLQLQAVKACLEEIQETTSHQPGDYIEARSGRSYLMIHQQLKSIVAGEAPPAQKAYVDEVKSLHRRLQDIVVLACCRFMNQKILQEQGLPCELKCRLSAAVGDDTALDKHMWSLLGNSKWHIFTSSKFRQRKRRRGERRDRKRTVNTVAADAQVNTVVAGAQCGSVFEPDEEPGSELPTVAADAQVNTVNAQDTPSWRIWISL